jgi:hypothetical protein
MTNDTKQTAATFNASADTVQKVDPDRFNHASWDDEQKRDVGEGDISASYSADVIAMMGKVRKPFTFQNQLWVYTGNRYLVDDRGETRSATAYHLMPIKYFEDTPVTYIEKTADSAAARADPNGFYHGITVMHRGQPHVLCGPPVNFIPGPSRQSKEIQPGSFSGM